jgi:hypothetical protein
VVIYDLIGHGVTLAFVIYFGLHLRQKVQTLQTTVTAQGKTIAAQSTMLQDGERLNKMMQQMMKEVITVVDPEAQLKRERAYKERAERDAAARVEAIKEEAQQHVELLYQRLRDLSLQGFSFIGQLLVYLPAPQQEHLIETSDLDSDMKDHFLQLVRGTSPASMDRNITLNQIFRAPR